MANDTTSDSPQPKRRRGASPAEEVKPKRGLNKLPSYLREDLGWPDWMAGTAIIVGGGLALTLFVWILIVAFPVAK